MIRPSEKVRTVDPSSTVDDLPAGTLFGGYEVIRKLGTGAFGAVYEALRMPLRKRTALKVLHPEFVRYPDVLKRFLREAEIVAQLEHPHIVGVFDLGVHDGRPYIAMEFLDGETLADRLDREGVIPVAEAVDLMLAVMSAVASVHDKAVVHRDLKPDNIFLARTATRALQPKLLDFGVVKVREAGSAMTMTRAMVGTPSYMSPEQAREARDVDAPSDQWSLAVILFECLTGKCPFDGENLLDILNAIATGPIPKLRSVMSTLPEGLETVLLRAMERQAADRWPSVRAFGEALRPYASVGGQALWEPFYTNEIAYVPTLHQWGAGDAPPPSTPLTLGDVASTIAIPAPAVLSSWTPPSSAELHGPEPESLILPRSRWWMVASGALVMGFLLAGGAVALYATHALWPQSPAQIVVQPPLPAPPVAAPLPTVAPLLAARTAPAPLPAPTALPPPPRVFVPPVARPVAMVAPAPAPAPPAIVRPRPAAHLAEHHPRTSTTVFSTLGY